MDAGLNKWIGELLSRLVGIRGIRLDDVDEIGVFWDSQFASPALFILAVVAVTGLGVWSSKREQQHLSYFRRIVLGCLRGLALLFLVLFLFRPVLKMSYIEHSKYSMALLLDDTDSLNIRDVRMAERDLKIAARVIEGQNSELLATPVKSWTGENKEKLKRIPRSHLLRKTFESSIGKPLFETLGAFDVRVFRVGEDARQLDDKEYDGDLKKACASLKFDQKATEVGGAMRASFRTYHGRKPYAILYVGDGSSNKGSPIANSARAVAASDTQLHLLLVGVGSAKDVQVEYVDAADVLFKDEKASFRTVLSQSGCEGESIEIVLKENGRVVHTQSITLEGPSQTVNIDYVPKTSSPKGSMHLYEVTAEGLPDEVDSSNNTKSKKTRIIDGKMKVLYVENLPRWEWRVMRDMMLRDRRVGPGNYKTLLIQADDRNLNQHPYYVREFPSAKDLMNYHALIIGDVDSRFFMPDQIKAINSFVGEWGGGLMMIAGDRFNPASFTGRGNEPIEKMMPVLYRSTRKTTLTDEVEEPMTEGFGLRLTPWAANYRFTAFDPVPRHNQQIWSSFEQFYWHASVRKLHPMAVPLVVHDSRKDEEGRLPLPLIAVRRYGKGQVVFIGIDETWRFRKEVGDAYHRTFWSQCVQYLGVTLLSGTRRIEMRADKKRYVGGEKVSVEATVFDREYKPLTADEIDAKIQKQGGEIKTIKLARASEEGLFRTTFVPEDEGDYVLWLEDKYSDDKASVEQYFSVQQPNIERDNPTIDFDALSEVAESTGGKAWRLDQLEEMKEALGTQTRKTPKVEQRPLWNTWLALLMLTLALTMEWGLRKKWNLR